jgi:xanthine dehydrogenase YagR molybdenum-binding subunit
MTYQPAPPVPAPAANIGKPAPRYEAIAKVTGAPIYAADTGLQRPLYAFFTLSGIAKGSIATIDTSQAAAVPGVVRIYTYKDNLQRDTVAQSPEGGRVSDSVMPLKGPHIAYGGEIVAVTVAESFEAARQAARMIKPSYTMDAPSATFDATGITVETAAEAGAGAMKTKHAGDFESGYAAAPVKLDATYSTPTQHHNPMELYSTTAVWHGDELTIYEPSQFVYGLKNSVAAALDIDPDKVTVINPFVGGAFGGKGIMTQRTPIIASIARHLQRPVKLVAMRDQGFTIATYRAETRHHVQLAAGHDGKLMAYRHEGWEITSRADTYLVGGVEETVEMYACPNIASQVNIVRADRSTPGFMRSPPETPYMYALEAAMDELAEKCGIDPIEFRRINDTQKSPINGAPYTSRSLMTCFDAAARSFGWENRQPRPGSMRDGDWQVGYGCATAMYPTNMQPASARIRLTPNGRAIVQIAAHDMGQGSYSVMQQLAAEGLNLPLSAITVQMGSTTLPAGPIAGGSMTTASAGSAVMMAAQKIAARFGNAMPQPAALPAAFERLGAGSIEEYAEYIPDGDPKDAIQRLQNGRMGKPVGGDDGGPLKFAFGANFIEVRVHRLTREIRVQRMTGAFAAGRIINPRTARSQYMGAMIWGMELALLEQTEIDRRRARYANNNYADYLIAVSGDVPPVEVILVPEVDRQVNPLGTKGIGELANVGMPAAVANAVYHATGKRVRDLPITLDKII